MQNIANEEILYEQRTLLKERGICVIIPTYNNAGTIADVVLRAKKQCDDIIVVCDGCTDNTIKILGSVSGISIVTHKKNLGKGAALRSGFKKAHESGFSYAITIDADGQHFPEDINLMVQGNLKYPGALLIGERKNLDKVERSYGSKFANKFSNFWFFVQTGKLLKDTQTGFRLYPLKKLYGLRFLTSRYEAELELLVLAAWHGVKIESISVDVYYPSKEERVSHFRPALDFTRISLLNTVLCLFAVLYGLPLTLLRKTLQFAVTIYSMAFFIISSLFVLTPFTMLYVAFTSSTETRQRNLRKILHYFARFIMVWHGVPRVKYCCATKGNIDFTTPSIIICNHQSHLDLMALMAEVGNIVFMTNNWVWNSPLFGYVIRKAGYILSSSGVENMEENVKYQLDQGVNVAIFPEGTRSTDCSIKRFHSGAFYLAKSLAVDITPAILYGTGKVLPKNRRLLNPGVIELYFDEKLKVAEIENEHKTMRGVASYVRKYYHNRYAKISNRIEQNV